MQVNFTSQSNHNNCSFGLCNFNVAIKNHDNPLKLAYSVIDLISATPKGRIYFKTPKEQKAVEIGDSLFRLIDYCEKPEVEISVNSRFSKRYLKALLSCFNASSAEEAKTISNKALEKLRQQRLDIQG